MAEYPYGQGSFSSGVSLVALSIAIDDEAGITTKLLSVTSDGEGGVVIAFEAVLSGGEETLLDAIIAAHDGQAPVTTVFHVALMLVPHETAIPSTSFECFCGCVSTPDFFTANPSGLRYRATGMIQTDGSAELRLIEDDSPISDSYEHGDTEDAWERFEFQSTVALGAGACCYGLECRLVGATAANIKNVTLSLMELI